MKTLLLPAAIAAAAITFAQLGHSQAPVPQSSMHRLQTMKAKNKELIDRQAETLKKLDELQQAAQQIKFLGKRA